MTKMCRGANIQSFWLKRKFSVVYLRDCIFNWRLILLPGAIHFDVAVWQCPGLQPNIGAVGGEHTEVTTGGIVGLECSKCFCYCFDEHLPFGQLFRLESLGFVSDGKAGRGSSRRRGVAQGNANRRR